MKKSPGRPPGRTQTCLSRTTVKNVTSPAQRVCRTIRSFHLKYIIAIRKGIAYLTSQNNGGRYIGIYLADFAIV